MTSRRKLREMLNRGETVVAPGAYDPLGALVIRELGFPATYIGGYMSGAHLGIIEPVMTLTEQVEVARKVANAVDLAVICDADAGFGDPIHVMRCVKLFEEAGAAAIHIEDKVYPERASYFRGLEHIIPLDQFLDKIRFALQARRDKDFLIIGRTDAFKAVEGGRDEMVRRGLALKESGVDAIVPRGAYGREDLAFFRKAVPGIPLMMWASGTDISVQEYAKLGYQILCYAMMPILGTVGAVWDNLQSLKETGLIPAGSERMRELRDRMENLIGLPEYYRLEMETTEKGSRE